MNQERLKIGLTELQAKTLDLVMTRRKGSEIANRDIANAIGLKPRPTSQEGADMRSIINALRRKGYPVIANGRGYYYPSSEVEVEEYIRSLANRMHIEQEALDGIRAGFEDWKEEQKRSIIEI